MPLFNPPPSLFTLLARRGARVLDMGQLAVLSRRWKVIEQADLPARATFEVLRLPYTSPTVAALQHLPRLGPVRELNFHGCELGNTEAVTIAEAFRSSQWLQALVLSGGKIGDVGAAAVAKDLVPKLASLDISFNRLRSGSLISIAQAAAGAPHLHRLNVAGHHAGYQVLAEMLGELRYAGVLSSLNLAGSQPYPEDYQGSDPSEPVPPSVISALDAVLSGNPNLSELDLTGSGISDPDAVAVLTRHAQLARITAYHCGLDALALSHLLNAPHVSRLYVDDNGLIDPRRIEPRSIDKLSLGFGCGTPEQLYELLKRVSMGALSVDCSWSQPHSAFRDEPQVESLLVYQSLWHAAELADISRISALRQFRMRGGHNDFQEGRLTARDFAALAQHPYLEALYVETDVDSDAIATLAQSTTLQTLELKARDLEGNSVAILAQMPLRHLVLHAWHDFKDVDAVLKAFHGHPTLESLSISTHAPIGIDAVNLLLRSIPRPIQLTLPATVTDRLSVEAVADIVCANGRATSCSHSCSPKKA